MTSGSCRSGPAAGFTLVELIVALALAALVSLIMMQGIGLATHGVGRLSEKLERVEQRRGLEMRLRRMLGSVAAIPVFDGRPAFMGGPSDLSFLSIVEDGGAGLYRVRLAFVPGRADRPVVLTRQPAEDGGTPRREEGVVARHVRALGFAYFGAAAPGESPAWHDRWEGATVPPRLLRVLFDDGDGATHPPMILRLNDGG